MNTKPMKAALPSFLNIDHTTYSMGTTLYYNHINTYTVLCKASQYKRYLMIHIKAAYWFANE